MHAAYEMYNKLQTHCDGMVFFLHCCINRQGFFSSVFVFVEHKCICCDDGLRSAP